LAVVTVDDATRGDIVTTLDAGWYQDPSVSTQLRYWDGQQWTEHTAPAPTNVPGTSYAASEVGFLEALHLGVGDWNFSRRGSRSEYWWLALVGAPTSFVGGLAWGGGRGGVLSFVGIFMILFTVVVLFKAAVRRYHDIGRSGWWAAVNVIVGLVASSTLLVGSGAALFGALGDASNGVENAFVVLAVGGGLVGFTDSVWALVWLCMPGKSTPNRWG
jgi:uncharacterized membrane protein YhaH (DUF805 family)